MRVKLRTKLFLLVAVVLAGICTIVFMANTNLHNVTFKLITALYTESDVNTSLVLNADRDLYQALIAHQYLITAPADTPMYADMQTSFRDNTLQAESRLHKAQDNLEKVPALYTQPWSDTSRLTIQKAFQNYWIEYQIWYEDALQMQKLHQEDPSLNIIEQWPENNRKFVNARSNSDVIGEILDQYAQNQSLATWSYQKRISRYIYLVGFMTILILLFISILLIRDILRSVKKATTLIEEAASGGFDKNSYEEIFKRQDEIGLIARAFDTVLVQHTEQIRSSHMDMIYRLSQLGEIHDSETARHVYRVGNYSSLLGQLAGLPKEQVRFLFAATSVHDIGKAGIPDVILGKQGPLSDEEWKLMKQHTVIGARVLEGGNSALLEYAMDVAMYHHERWDGRGYPSGLCGLDIPVFARICAVSDAFDAMTTQRPYKNALSVEEAVEEIRNHAGTQFDPWLAELFVSNIDRFLIINNESQRDVFIPQGHPVHIHHSEAI